MTTKIVKKQDHMRIIALGGLGEIGRNMTLFEYQRKIFIIDMGLRFPDADMPGIDFLVPNIEYLKGREKDIVGIGFTHGHYDHIGAVPYLVHKFSFNRYPMFASGLTRAIILKRQEDFPMQPRLNIEEIKDGTIVNLGPFRVEFFKQNHNISDNTGIIVSCVAGSVLHTSDFKFDNHPVNDKPTDFNKLKAIGRKGITLLMSDSTGAEDSGHSLSEKEIFENLEEIFKQSKGKIIAATFGSLINRIQQLITLSEKYGRKIAVDGYSMRTNVEICKKLGYIKAKKGTLIPAKEIKNYPDSKVTLVCTGAQGEGQAVLMRIANKEYSNIQIGKGDTIIFSSSVIPGNERAVQTLKDNLIRQKADVYHYGMMDIHAVGHAKKEELGEMIKLIHPKFFVPIHGQYSMLVAHSKIAQEIGMPEKNIVVAENGYIINLDQNKISVEPKSVPANYIMVDGLGIADVGEVVLRDRQVLARDGMFVIVAVIDKKSGKVKSSPDIISRGFVYLKESKELLAQTRKKVIEIINRAASSDGAINWVYVKDEIKNKVGEFLFHKTQRKPMVLPVVIEA